MRRAAFRNHTLSRSLTTVLIHILDITPRACKNPWQDRNVTCSLALPFLQRFLSKCICGNRQEWDYSVSNRKQSIVNGGLWSQRSIGREWREAEQCWHWNTVGEQPGWAVPVRWGLSVGTAVSWLGLPCSRSSRWVQGKSLEGELLLHPRIWNHPGKLMSYPFRPAGQNKKKRPRAWFTDVGRSSFQDWGSGRVLPGFRLRPQFANGEKNSLSASIPICLSWLCRNHYNGFVL